MEPENNLSPYNYLEIKNKEVKIRHPLEDDKNEINSSQNVEINKENDNKVSNNDGSEANDQNKPSAGILFFHLITTELRENHAENKKKPSTQENNVSHTKTVDKNKSQSQKKDLKDMTEKELAAHYKSLFLKSKKLILHYEEELNQLKNNVSNLKQKLKEYESGKNNSYRNDNFRRGNDL